MNDIIERLIRQANEIARRQSYLERLEHTSSVSAPTFLAPPAGCVASVISDTTIRVVWEDNSSDEDGFQIHRSTDGVSYSQLDTAAANATSYDDTTPVADTTYYYKVRATKVAETSLFSNASHTAIITSGEEQSPEPPSAPTTLAAVTVSTAQIDLTWSEGGGAETGFYIYRSYDGVSYTLLDTNSASDTTYSATGLQAYVHYWFKVSAYNASGESDYSNVVDIDTLYDPGVGNSTYFVATDGSDAADGSKATPWLTWDYAFEQLTAGDILYVRGGTYDIGTTSAAISGLSGASGDRIYVWAYPGESPVLDGTNLTDNQYSILRMTNCNYWHLKGLHFKNGAQYSISVVRRGLALYGSSSYNFIERCEFSYNEGPGFHLEDTTTGNVIVFCYSHHNYDPLDDGGGGDGFHMQDNTCTGNLFYGCHAYMVSDDGFDTWNSDTQTLIRCLATFAGYRPDGSLCNDYSMGFKLGSDTTENASNHIIARCIAYHSGLGFSNNSSTQDKYLYNNTAWGNIRKDFKFENTGGRFYNNLLRTSSSYRTISMTDLATNSYQLSGVSSDADLGLLGMSEADLSTYLSPGEASVLRNAGTDISGYVSAATGLDTTPDVGALQYGETIDDLIGPDGFLMIAPYAPTGLTATAASDTQIDLAWNDNGGYESHFLVERSPDNSTWAVVAVVYANAEAYSNTGLTASTKYYYRVRAKNDGGFSGYSNTADATTSS